MPDDLTPSARTDIKSANHHALLAFRERLTRLAPALPTGALVELIPLAVVYDATGHVRISVGTSVPLPVASEALRVALAQVDGLITPTPN